jgi:hypothetical protein
VQKTDLRPDWRPGDTAIVYADFELTSCYLVNEKTIAEGNWTCNSEKVKEWAKDSSIDAYVLYRLEVADIDSTGRADACYGPSDVSNGSDDASHAPGWTFWPVPGQGYNGGDYRRERISVGMHHKKFYTALKRKTSANPNCSRLLVRVYLKAHYRTLSTHRFGQPIKIDTARVDARGRVKWTYANGAIWLER